MAVSTYLLRIVEWLTWLLAAAVSPLAALWKLVRLRIHQVILAEKFGGTRAYPLVGSALGLKSFSPRDIFLYCFDESKKHGRTFRFYVGPVLLIYTMEKEDLEMILSGQKFIEKNFMYKLLHPWLGTGLLTSGGEKWRKRRKLLTPAFHFKILEQFMPVFNSCGEEFVRQLRRQTDGRVFDVYPLVELLTLDVICGLTKFLLKLSNKYGTLFRGYAGPILLVCTGRNQDHEQVLAANDYLSKGPIYIFLKPWLGDGLLISTGEKWHSRCKLLTPAFHFKILDQFVPVFNSNGDEFIRQLRKRADGSAFDIWPLIKLLTLDIICETIMGVKMNAVTNSESPYVTAVNDISSLNYGRGMRPWEHPSFIFRFTKRGRRHQHCLDILHGTTEKVIRERKVELDKLSEGKALDVDELGRRRRVAFLDLLLLIARDGSLSDSDIREEVDTFMFEGHDTTAAAISFTIFLLSRHMDVQEKVLEELESIFDISKSFEHTIQELSELKYLEMVIKESLRIYPPVAAVARQITSDLRLASSTEH